MFSICPDYIGMRVSLIDSAICISLHVRLKLIFGLGHTTMYMSTLQYMLMIKQICEKIGNQLNGTGPIKFHISCDFFWDDHGVLCMALTKYIELLVSNHQQLFRFKPKLTEKCTPHEKGDPLELDTIQLLNPDGVKNYQSIIGSPQCAVSWVQFNIATTVMTLSSLWSAPGKSIQDEAWYDQVLYLPTRFFIPTQLSFWLGSISFWFSTWGYPQGNSKASGRCHYIFTLCKC